MSEPHKGTEIADNINWGDYPFARNWYLLASFFAINISLLATQIAGIFKTSTVTADVPSWSDLLISLLTFHVTGVLVIGTIVVLCLPQQYRRQELSIHHIPKWHEILHHCKTLIWLIPGILIINGIILKIFEMANWSISDDLIMDSFLQGPASVIIVLIIGAVIIAPVSEELFFRIVIFRTCHHFLPKGIAAIITSLLFAIFHFRPEQVVPLFILAMILQFKLESTQSLFHPIILHALFNGVMIGAVLFTRFYWGSI